MKTLTWNTNFNTGSISNDMSKMVYTLTVKPDLSFPFMFLLYEEAHNRFLIDDKQMTDVEKQNCSMFIDRYDFSTAIPLGIVSSSNITPEQQMSYAAMAFLQATDWYVVRQQETNIPVPSGVLEKRAAARKYIIEKDKLGVFTPATGQILQTGVPIEKVLELLK